MTRHELKQKRHALGKSAEGFARLVRVESGRTVRRWEDGTRSIPGPVTAILDILEELERFPAIRERVLAQIEVKSRSVP